MFCLNGKIMDKEGVERGDGEVKWDRIKGSGGKELRVEMKLDGYEFVGYVKIKFVKKV